MSLWPWVINVSQQSLPGVAVKEKSFKVHSIMHECLVCNINGEKNLKISKFQVQKVMVLECDGINILITQSVRLRATLQQ